MSENASLPERPEEKTSTSLVRVDSAAPARPVNVRRAIRRAERDARRAGAAKVRPLRAVGTVAAVGALIAGVAFPAYAAIQSEGEVVSMHDVAAGAAQSLVVASEVDAPKVAGSSYAATTPEEVEKAKAEKAAAERAKKQAEAAAAAAAAAAKAAASSATTYGSVASVPSVPAPAASGSVTFPLPGGYTVGQSLGSGRGHQGLDLLIATGTPIYAVADGVVATAGYSGAYGNLVVLNANVDGSAVEVRNGHMSSMAVSPGQSVTAGQVIGYVGSTGRSTAPHLHIEVRVNGGLVDPLYWLPM